MFPSWHPNEGVTGWVILFTRTFPLCPFQFASPTLEREPTPTQHIHPSWPPTLCAERPCDKPSNTMIINWWSITAPLTREIKNPLHTLCIKIGHLPSSAGLASRMSISAWYWGWYPWRLSAQMSAISGPRENWARQEAGQMNSTQGREMGFCKRAVKRGGRNAWFYSR